MDTDGDLNFHYFKPFWKGVFLGPFFRDSLELRGRGRHGKLRTREPGRLETVMADRHIHRPTTKKLIFGFSDPKTQVQPKFENFIPKQYFFHHA